MQPAETIRTNPRLLLVKKLSYCLSLWSLSSFGQPKSLSIGDAIPTIQFTNLINYKSSSAHLSDFKGKLFILDFFATWCTACIRELPKLDSLQKKFAGQLQIILVAHESTEKLNAFRKKNKLFADCTLPVVTSDSILKKLFPFKYFPHEVWINEQGRVDAITEPIYINADNINAWLSSKKLHLPLKADALDFDFRKPLLQNGNGGDESSLLFRSLLTYHLKGMGGSSGHITDTNTTRWYYINATILILYMKALGFESNRIILQVADPSRYILPAEQTEEWKDNNLYCYELTAPAHTSKDTLNSLMFHDLNRYLGLNGRMEKRLVKCFALKNNSAFDTLISTKSLTPHITVNEKTGNCIFQNQSMQAVVATFNSYNSPAPGKPIIVDETGITVKVDMEIPSDALNDFTLLQRSLLSYGLTLIPVERELDMFILTEPNFKKL